MTATKPLRRISANHARLWLLNTYKEICKIHDSLPRDDKPLTNEILEITGKIKEALKHL